MPVPVTVDNFIRITVIGDKASVTVVSIPMLKQSRRTGHTRS
jgi:hypothetical protein